MRVDKLGRVKRDHYGRAFNRDPVITHETHLLLNAISKKIIDYLRV